MTTLIHARVDACRNGTNPKTIARVESGWVVLGDVQFLPGYSLLLPDPVVESLNDLDQQNRKVYLHDMSVIGDALLAVTESYRINYEILGNTEAALHAHIFPRYLSEPEARRKQPAWGYNWQTAIQFDADRDAALMQAIAGHLQARGATHRG